MVFSHYSSFNYLTPFKKENICLPPIQSFGPPSPSKSNPLKADGFSRSGLHTFLKDGYRKELLVESVSEKVAESIKKTDPARFVDMCDPQGVASTYK
jgi:hypothetical protein